MEDNLWLLAQDSYALSESVTIAAIETTILLSDLYAGTDDVKEGWITPEE